MTTPFLSALRQAFITALPIVLMALLCWLVATMAGGSSILNGLGVYCLALGLGLFLALLYALTQTSLNPSGSATKTWLWLGRWHGVVALMVAAGAVLGALAYSVGGLLLQLEGRLMDFLLKGLKDGAFYALIWAPGIGIVLCLMWARKSARATVADAS
jgi:hypothetical protein